MSVTKRQIVCFGAALLMGLPLFFMLRGSVPTSAAIFVPFVTQELFQGGGAMYYGVNAKTRNMIMLDRKRARCPNGLKLGTPGSGKSMSCKSEIASVFLTAPDDIFVCDPEAEYFPLVQRLHGQVIKLSPTGRAEKVLERADQTREPPEPEEPEPPAKENKGGMGGLLVLLIVALAGSGEALYYFKFHKPKADESGSTDLSEYDFDDEDEPENEETEDEEK